MYLVMENFGGNAAEADSLIVYPFKSSTFNS